MTTPGLAYDYAPDQIMEVYRITPHLLWCSIHKGDGTERNVLIVPGANQVQMLDFLYDDPDPDPDHDETIAVLYWRHRYKPDAALEPAIVVQDDVPKHLAAKLLREACQ